MIFNVLFWFLVLFWSSPALSESADPPTVTTKAPIPTTSSTITKPPTTITTKSSTITKPPTTINTQSSTITKSPTTINTQSSTTITTESSTTVNFTTLPSTSTTRKEPIQISQSLCFQKRSLDAVAQKIYHDFCGSRFTDNFCDYVQCMAIESCPDGEILVENAVGRGCCPTCVKQLEEGDHCDPEATLTRCKNGLICEPSTKPVCKLPEKNQDRLCLKEYHNRWLVAEQRKSFYIPSDNGKKYFAIRYAQEQYRPSCTFDGHYEPKQKSRNKAYCVNTNDGKPSFGISDSHRSVNQTCKCSESMNEKLSKAVDRLNPNSRIKVDLNNVNTEFNSDTHMKCKASGNYQEIQCINSTCLCVNEKTGRPVLDVQEILNIKLAIEQNKILYQPPLPKYYFWPTTVVFDARNRLACYDGDKNKTKKMEINKIYTEECFTELQRSSMMTYHFSKKGTTLEGLDKTRCGYDDRFNRVQCPDATCSCHDPEGNRIGAYGAESIKSATIDCRCALEEYLAKTEPYDILRCDAGGNFWPIQCFSNDKICYCTDNNGARISEQFFSQSMYDFIDRYAPNRNIRSLCDVMRQTLTNNELIEKDEEMFYDSSMAYYTKKTWKPDPDQIFNDQIIDSKLINENSKKSRNSRLKNP